ncbi:DegT/DnrJ/EryC1/StrS family aminotransferase [Halorubrum ezzemoulense]|uniref:DegT/DnrJ/EryC1/StrS family aminotransferase n=1 Tax=Halorubrum ezzemoulense TaxID=337243 RepID=UPI00232DA920|nr:DegT/DnrJ/EryC1/StrS family aminotransferase [Halorubrum ezzemoulense]MDB2269877.1 DegT/DnrJ/EryC1/StrS family aminotransferase [Halorubrum ezzemoulense]
MIYIANPEFDAAEKDAVADVLDSGMVADGEVVRSFESEFADYCGTDHGIATSNGTTALHATLEALDISEGDRVLTTPFSFIATANAIRFTGAEPVFADIDPETYNLDPEAAAETAREEDVDAIMTVHLYGLASDLDPLGDLADDLDIPLIEDAAQAHGATYKDTRVGSFGDAACFSFYPTKNMTTGEGGMITTDRDDVAERARRYINHGRTGKYEHAEVGHNYRMTNIAAAIGREQLEKLPDYIAARRANAAKLTAGLTDTPVVTPTTPPDREHAYHQYTVRAPDRDDLDAYLEENGVGASVYYPRCIHTQPAYDDVTCTARHAEIAAQTVLSLPVHPALTDSDIDHIIEVIQNYA